MDVRGTIRSSSPIEGQDNHWKYMVRQGATTMDHRRQEGGKDKNSMMIVFTPDRQGQ